MRRAALLREGRLGARAALRAGGPGLDLCVCVMLGERRALGLVESAVVWSGAMGRGAVGDGVVRDVRVGCGMWRFWSRWCWGLGRVTLGFGQVLRRKARVGVDVACEYCRSEASFGVMRLADCRRF